MARAITHVATTDISEMMDPGPGRRMDLPGFDAEFVDFPHYIIRITERIWHDREVGLCLDWYADDCVIHTLGGDIRGASTVVDNTWATLRAFPDRRLDADNVIWSDEGGGSFYSSHLITSKMTNLGDSDFGPATGRKVRARTIADCLCRENRIVEEWLVRDNLAIALQLGFDPDAIAARQAASDAARGFDLPAFHAAAIERARAGHQAAASPGSAAQVACDMLEMLWNARRWSEARRWYDFRVGAAYPGGESLYGPDQVAAWLEPLFAALPDARLSVGHVAEIPYLGEARDVAICWTLAGTHAGAGRYGPPTGAAILVLGVSHFRVINGRIREEVTIWDDLAVRRQLEAARRAG